MNYHCKDCNWSGDELFYLTHTEGLLCVYCARMPLALVVASAVHSVCSMHIVHSNICNCCNRVGYRCGGRDLNPSLVLGQGTRFDRPKPTAALRPEGSVSDGTTWSAGRPIPPPPPSG